MQYPHAKQAALLATLTLAAFGSAASQAAPPVSVIVNGDPVSFTGTPPAEENGSVLVPLRGVFEAMGAVVDYDPGAHIISASKGSSQVVLPIGASTAKVNGQPEYLSQPATVVDGTTLVPLRFIAESLGAYVDWKSASRTVLIQTGDSHLASLPSPENDTVTGKLTGVYTNTDPEQITLRVDGQNTAIPITSHTLILRGGTDIPLRQLAAGDQVTVQRGADGVAESISSSVGQVRGTVKSIGRLENGDHVLTLNDGTTVELASDATVTMNGRRIAFGDIIPDEQVRIRTNEDNSLGTHVYVNPQGGSDYDQASSNTSDIRGNLITAFNADVPRDAILDTGSRIRFTLRAQPGGQANVNVPGIDNSIPLYETEPGVYKGSYTVENGQMATQALVTAHYTSPDGSSFTESLPDYLHIAAVGSVSPVILDPIEGAHVGRTISMHGTAEPGATVRVKVDYMSNGLGGLLNLRGTAGTQDVTADSTGYWEVTDLPLSTSSVLANSSDTQYRISATTVSASGDVSPETVLDVRGGRVYAHHTNR